MTSTSSSCCSLKTAVLVALALQQAGLVLVIRYSKMRGSSTTTTHYISSTAVVSAEFCKIVLNVALALVVLPPKRLTQLIFRRDALKMTVPALLYVLQNNLLFVALAHLSVPIYQVTNQAKLLTTALCSRILLGKQTTWMQYTALMVLATGVALVNLSGKSTQSAKVEEEKQQEWIGLAAVIFSAFTSGFAGVYFEKVLKAKKTTTDITETETEQDKAAVVYVRNAQLALWSLWLGMVPVVTKDLKAIQNGKGGFFQGYDGIVLAVIVCQAMTGLIVGLVFKYADAVLKGFSTSVAVVLAALVSFLVWPDQVQLDAYFLFGTVLVMASVQLYTNHDKVTAQLFGTRDQSSSLLPKQEEQQEGTEGSNWFRPRKTHVLGALLLMFIIQQLLRESSFSLAYKDYLGNFESKSNYIQWRTLANNSPGEKQCRPLRNLTNSPPWKRPQNVGTQTTRYQHCLRYTCDWKNHGRCDNTAPTNYDGPEQPCCVHILRDMAKAFDDAMCELGFEYFSSYGMLLGLIRSDKLIPWTMDNDYIATKETISAILALPPGEKAVFAKHGISFFYDNFFRLCIIPEFMGGKLAKKWKTKKEGWYPLIYPYTDVFIAREEEGYMVDELDCAHPMDTFRPAVRRAVYNNSFHVSFPKDHEKVVSAVYGPNWRTPDAKKNPHGNTRCAKNQFALLKGKKQSQLPCGGGKIGNGVCEDSSLCCSKWGYCGNTTDHCEGGKTGGSTTKVAVEVPAAPTLQAQKVGANRTKAAPTQDNKTINFPPAVPAAPTPLAHKAGANVTKPATTQENKTIDFQVPQEKQCRPLRDLTSSPPWKRPQNIGTQTTRYQHCLQFTCDWKNHGRCDNTAPTNYDGPEQPCCVHILRDMAKAFDDAMCELGFEYFSSYGMLLGLIRSDKLIPWTMDNDYIATEKTISAILALPPEEKAVFAKHGISFFYDNFFRLCITPEFMGGKLAQKWKTQKEGWYPLIYPYTDVFIAREVDGFMVDELDCAHPMQNFRPAVRRAVYNNSFHVSFPKDHEEVVSAVYGPNWRTPDARKSPHGNTRCAKNQFSQLKAKLPCGNGSVGNGVCADTSECCSPWGYCGNTTQHCTKQQGNPALRRKTIVEAKVAKAIELHGQTRQPQRPDRH